MALSQDQFLDSAGVRIRFIEEGHGTPVILIHGYTADVEMWRQTGVEEGQAPHEIGRAKFGRISIANSDSEATPLMDAAFDAAWRAVEEQTA
jgi:pimeloyl-ACP methyl ester carboxylesterase